MGPPIRCLDVQLSSCVSTLAHTVTRSVFLDAAPGRVWDAITDERALSEWLAPEVELEPREGGEVVCRYEDGEERRGEVEVVEEAERLASTGGESRAARAGSNSSSRRSPREPA